MSKKGIVLVFGVFDRLHEGHSYFLGEAKKLGGELVVALTPASVVALLKKKLPKDTFLERKRALLTSVFVDRVVKGDEKIGSWDILGKVKPDIVALGYDQKEIGRELSKMAKNKGKNDFSVIFIKPYKPRIFHSRLLKNG